MWRLQFVYCEVINTTVMRFEGDGIEIVGFCLKSTLARGSKNFR